MKIKLPGKYQDGKVLSNQVIDGGNIVIIGANGSGKTRFGVNIERNHVMTCHRISAQKSLSIPDQVRPSSKESAENDFLYGDPNKNVNNKILRRWGNKPENGFLNDYVKLITLLHTDAYEVVMEFHKNYEKGLNPDKPVTKLDHIKKIWEDILPHRELEITAGTMGIRPKNNPNDKYKASDLSDGERVIFYFIGSVLSVPKNTIVIIDEPEIHLHNSILKKLWDKIENIRPDCTFIYLTHSIDFASSRTNSKKIWVKEYRGNNIWDYEIIDDTKGIPEKIYLEIIGSRKPIIFVEGVSGSKLDDSHIYQHLFPEYTIKPVGSCEKVIEYAKSFNDNFNLHNLVAYGIVDKDRRTPEEINSLKTKNILVLEVAEIENLLIIEDLINVMANNGPNTVEDLVSEVKNNVYSFCNSILEYQAFEYAKYTIEREVSKIASENCGKNISKYQLNFEQKFGNYNVQEIYDEHHRYLKNIIDSKNYEDILKIFNSKGIFPQSNVVTLCGYTENGYLSLINKLIAENSSEGEFIRNAMRKYVDPDNILAR
ncbi:DUF4435 domain-containing protein [Methanococcus maripaludis]|uniref:Uncharacterized protein n=1 Tax=Methanococcus maripaludis TaxID=39152 RepID=A0A7J9PMF7_METMI|nr:DUF4435 domain-containing protein [Methanococcus maripaludis]MBA2864412.1 hypothetical protein [Methanococcus maripaludis]